MSYEQPNSNKFAESITTDNTMIAVCWYHRFLTDPCNNPGLYAKLNSESVFVRETYWCELHKHDDDVRI